MGDGEINADLGSPAGRCQEAWEDSNQRKAIKFRTRSLKGGDRANHLEFIGSSSRGLEIFFSIKF